MAKFESSLFPELHQFDLKPEDVRSMCCRLQMDLREPRKRTGGRFGAGDLTGSIGVVTLNLPKLAYPPRARRTSWIWSANTRAGQGFRSSSARWSRTTWTTRACSLFPGRYLKNGFRGHFSTIGLLGGHERLNLPVGGIETEAGIPPHAPHPGLPADLDRQVPGRDRHLDPEAERAEGTSYRLAKIDKKLYADIQASGNGVPYYTNSTLLPVGYTRRYLLL